MASETAASVAALSQLIAPRPLRPTAMLQRSASLDSPHHDPLPQGVRQFPFDGPPPPARKLGFRASSEEGGGLPFIRKSQGTRLRDLFHQWGTGFHTPPPCL